MVAWPTLTRPETRRGRVGHHRRPPMMSWHRARLRRGGVVRGRKRARELDGTLAERKGRDLQSVDLREAHREIAVRRVLRPGAEVAGHAKPPEVERVERHGHALRSRRRDAE